MEHYIAQEFDLVNNEGVGLACYCRQYVRVLIAMCE